MLQNLPYFMYRKTHVVVFIIEWKPLFSEEWYFNWTFHLVWRNCKLSVYDVNLSISLPFYMQFYDRLKNCIFSPEITRFIAHHIDELTLGHPLKAQFISTLLGISIVTTFLMFTISCHGMAVKVGIPILHASLWHFRGISNT